jgi:hypothetical protein
MSFRFLYFLPDLLFLIVFCVIAGLAGNDGRDSIGMTVFAMASFAGLKAKSGALQVGCQLANLTRHW